MSIVAAGLTTFAGFMIANALKTGEVTWERNPVLQANEPLAFWFSIALMGLGSLTLGVVAVALWWAVGNEKKADAIMARRDIPLDRAVRATQDPEA
ncbi:MAG: hypothetical protein EON88_12790 [Brevundimonas sp.]|nr:MAG: hypothetical protein EON88_12790 [Brevundimonas sp.]